MICHVCGEADTAEDSCTCIICECGKKTRDDEIVVGKDPNEKMYCSAQCAKESAA
jgi:hypothetical protein